MKQNTASKGQGLLEYILAMWPIAKRSIIATRDVLGCEFSLNVNAGASLEVGNLCIVSTPGPGD